MNDFGCGKENQVLEAQRSDEISPELMNHVATCAACTDLVLVSKFLQSEAENVRETALPDAGLVWRKAQLRSRHEALARATWPIRFVGGVAALTSVVVGLWLVFSVTELPTWLSDIGNYGLQAEHLGRGYWAEVALRGGAGILLCAFLGSLYVLLPDNARMRLGRPSLS
jgi:hypothetical protein